MSRTIVMGTRKVGAWPNVARTGLAEVGSPPVCFPLYCRHYIDLEHAPEALCSRSRPALRPRIGSIMELLADLTAAQVEAVTHINGPLLVLAGAGSGKTRVITRRVAHLLHSGIRADQVLALTFTNKAAGEMRERIEALVPNSRVLVGTFHGFCARMLRKYAPLVGIDNSFSIYDQNDRVRAVRDVMEQLGLGESSLTPEKIDSMISRAKNDLKSPRALRQRALDPDDKLVALVYEKYEERLRQAAAVDFDDLLVHMVTILREHKDVRAELDRRFSYVLVDEYQDTNMAQYAIVRALSVDHPNICVTGDPDQSIYGWRGANLTNILEFEKDFPGCRVVTLERNYRSTKNIISVADHLIKFNSNRKPKSLRTENPVGEPIELTIYPRETDEAEGIAGKIAQLVREGEYRLADIAVFCRVTALTRPIEQAFRAARIPYQVVGGVAFYERQEIKDVLAYLNLTVNPKDDMAFTRVVNVPPRGLGKTSIEHLTTAARQRGVPLLEMAREARSIPALKDKAGRGLEDFGRLIDELAAWRDRAALEVVEQLLSRIDYRAHLKADSRDNGDDRLANLDELITAAREFDLDHPESSIQDFLAEITLASAIDRWDDNSGAVTLMTLHAAKGLEFPVVFIIALENGLLPHARAGENSNQVEEERRLLFVGITRARRELYLSQCVMRTFRGQQQATFPSKFLSELPEGPIVVRDLSGVGRPGNPQAYGLGRRQPYRQDPRPAPLPRDFRLMTAADLAAASGVILPGAAQGLADLDAFKPGVSVVHPEFGLGRITAIEGEGAGRKGHVAFAVGPARTFILAKSPLRDMARPAPGGFPPRGTGGHGRY
jgi:DNA helicase II / ATP-dependent DNA helicase PcrA